MQNNKLHSLLSVDLAILTAFFFTLLIALLALLPLQCAPSSRTAATSFVLQEMQALQSGKALIVHPSWRDDIITSLKDKPSINAYFRILPALAHINKTALPKFYVLWDSKTPLPDYWRKHIIKRIDDSKSAFSLLTLSSTAKEQQAIRQAAKEEQKKQAKKKQKRLDKRRNAQAILQFIKNNQWFKQVKVSLVSSTHEVLKKAHYNNQKQRFEWNNEADWIWVGPKKMHINGKEQLCIWAHPPKTGGIWLEIPLNKDPQHIKIQASFSDRAGAKTDGAAVKAELYLDNEKHSELLRKTGKGFVTSIINIEKDNNTAKYPRYFNIYISTTDNGMRHYCFNLQFL